MGSTSKFKRFLLLSFCFLFLCLAGLLQIKEKAGMPFTIISSENILIVTETNKGTPLKRNDILISVDNHQLAVTEEIEVITDGKKIGEQVSVKYQRTGAEYTDDITLVKYYRILDLIAYLLSGMLFLGVGLITVIKSSHKIESLLFYWGCTGAALIITMTPGSYVVINQYIGFFTRFIFHLAYSVTPVIFVHFILNFPRENKNKTPLIIKIFYVFAFFLSIVLTLTFISGVINNSSIQIKQYVWIYDRILRTFIIINFLSAVFWFIVSYKRIATEADRKKLKWILFGFVIGPLAYIICWVLPHLVFNKGLLPEFLIIAMLAAVPITFAIAIIRYHIFDIDIIINRSVVYLTVIALLILLYIVLFTLISFSIKGVDDTIPAVISVSVAALVLQPARKKIQSFVDRKFFRVQYNYREALRNFLEEIDNCIDIKQLAKKIVNHINEILPVEKIGFFELQLPGDKISLIAHQNFEYKRKVIFKRSELKTDLSKPVALANNVEEGIDIELDDSGVFERWGMVLVFPFRSVQNEIFGFLVLGKKKSGFRFTVEDIDLLNAVRSKVATTMERNKYHQELIKEQLENERLTELNKMKSFIVSRVSHDFRTPLSTISIFSDLLRNSENVSRDKFLDYLKIIEGESNRLKIMVENVLDFSKIEKGVFEYTLEKVNLNNLVDEVLRSMQYQLKMHKFTLTVNLCEHELNICADRIGIEAVLLNLITNSIKYSADKKVLTLLTGIENNFTYVSVEDEGIGISKEDIENIFNPFLRGHNIDAKKVRGAGLGLSIVKHIMDAHKGKIEVISELGKGSCFTLLFPNNVNERLQ